MCKKLVYSFSCVLMLGLVLTSAADAELVGWWQLDDGSGTTAFDSSGNGNDGTLEGNPQWVEGQLGGALEGNGNGDYIRVPHSDSLDISDAVTVALWVYGGIPPDQVICKGSGGGAWWASYGFRIDDNASYARQINFRNRIGTNADAINSASPIPPDEWTHVAITFDVNAQGNNQKIYINGQLDAESRSENPLSTNTDDLLIGADAYGTTRWHWQGMLDDIRIYNEALPEGQIQAVMLGGGASYPLASGPSPADGAIHEATWVSLGWRSGDSAVSHDVYMGDNFDDVNNGAAGTFQGNLADTTLIAGFTGFPFPDGLVPGTTYYWRIDEVNEADPNSPWKGDVWSFMVPPRTAYNPVPAEGARFTAPEPTLSWTAGFGGKLHTVYFGDNFDEVSNATGGLPQAETEFAPAGPLEPEKTYYWRVDEFDAITTTGDVWSFEVAGEGGGVKGEYFQGMNFNALMLTRIDPQIDFDWGNPGGPDPLLGDDQFSARWTGQVEAVFSETYTFYTNSDDGVRLWVDGKRLVNNWTNHSNAEDKGTVDLVTGQTYSLVMEYYEDGGGAVAQLHWESPSTQKQLIPAAALSFLTNAHGPSPVNGIVGVKLQSALTWKPGEFAASHEVYFGTDADAVANATKASPEFKASKALGDESLDPGMLAFDTDYFWRVDEVNNTNPDSPWVGSVWSLSTGPFLVVEDFESYDDIDPLPGEPGINRIFDKWIDGYGTTTNGALVGNDLPPYAEQTVVHGGAQSMIYRYDNAGKTSEATLTLDWPRDWTAEGVTKLSLRVRGSSANAADRIFVALNGTAVVFHDDPAATQLGGWNEWAIDLAAFGGDLTNVNSITIGIGTRNAPAPDGGTGTVHFDDIRLIR